MRRVRPARQPLDADRGVDDTGVVTGQQAVAVHMGAHHGCILRVSATIA
jgi:hypothetical protein